MKQKRDEDRELAMVALFREGYTLQEIGDEFDLTRERVRQLLKRHGLTGKDGGQRRKTLDKEAEEEQEKENRCIERWGMGRRELRKLRAMHPNRWKSPIGYFVSQRNNAKKRGIQWNLTLKEWWDIWQESGKWDQRGRNSGEYVMARYGDTGPYEVGNVKIIQCSDNVREVRYRERLKKLTNEKSHASRLSA